MSAPYDGEVFMTLGEKGVAGNDLYHFATPSDVPVALNGDILVANGHKAGATIAS